MKALETKEDFDSFLQENKLAFIDFYADWCGPCRMIAPKIEELATKYTNIKFAKVNVDENAETAESQSISAMPTFRLFQDGTKVGEVVGASEAKIVELLEKYK